MATTSKQVTSAMEDYLKAIYRLEERDTAVTTQQLAGELGVSGASVTNMLKRLADLKLVNYFLAVVSAREIRRVVVS